ncbi:MAG: hypothetical protein KJO28_05850 [Desulfofustis sp.]|nr:hypothetical protein [Desulfofustis sp.]
MKERRSNQERRQRQIRFEKFLLFGGNRHMVRRTDDKKQIILLDRYDSSLLYSVLTILCLSLVDGTLTLLLVERGAVELNPVMQYYLTLGPKNFLLAKYGITALALFILVVLHTVTSKVHRIGIYLLPFCKLTFGSVIIWELFLLYR